MRPERRISQTHILFPVLSGGHTGKLLEGLGKMTAGTEA